MVAFAGCTVFPIVHSFILLLLPVGKAGFDSLPKLAGQPRIRVHPLLGGF